MTAKDPNKTIAKNTIMLYIRMFISMIISLYTSRVVLQILGVTDYGVFSVIGGVVTMFSFFNSTMAGATSRFLTFELGRGNQKRLEETFATSVILHFLIAIIVTIIGETVGVWFLTNKLVIPESQKYAAQYVLQFSILSMFFSIVQVPFSASIISHEKMGIFAFVEITNSLLRLLIVYLLVVISFNKLILYSILTSAISIIIAILYYVICKSKFSECRIRLIWDKELIKPMLSFSSWDLYGNFSVMARTQGVNMLLNMWFGPVMNTASDIAARVQSVVLNLSTNITTAIRPQIIKSYSNSEYSRMLSLMRNGSRIAYVLMLYFAIPIIIETKYILNLWLGEVPEYSIALMRFSLLWNIAVSMTITLNYCVHATGYVKFTSFCSGTLFLLIVPITYFLYKLQFPYWIPYLLNIISVVFASIFSSFTIKRFVKSFSYSKMVLMDILKEWVIVGVLVCMIGYITFFIEEGFYRLIVVTILNIICVTVMGLYIVFPKTIRLKIFIFFQDKICKKA